MSGLVIASLCVMEIYLNSTCQATSVASIKFLLQVLLLLLLGLTISSYLDYKYFLVGQLECASGQVLLLLVYSQYWF